jgi:hypothetical protein
MGKVFHILRPEEVTVLKTPDNPAWSKYSNVSFHRGLPLMHEHGKSDRCVGPTKSLNKGAVEPPQGSARATPAEAVEGRRLAKSHP